jgi:hypothetical protein
MQAIMGMLQLPYRSLTALLQARIVTRYSLFRGFRPRSPLKPAATGGTKPCAVQLPTSQGVPRSAPLRYVGTLVSSYTKGCKGESNP